MTRADRIKHRREEIGMTQKELADKVGFKDKTSITKIESQGDKVTLKTIEKLAKALDCSEESLLGYGFNVKQERAIEEYFKNYSPPSEEYYDQIAKDFIETKGTMTSLFPNRIHLLGRVAAGSPIFAEENIIGVLDVPFEWSNIEEYFGLIIK